MGTTFSQLFPPTATYTEKNVPSQKGKVFLITGGYSGVGYELASIVYQAGAKVYVAGRSEEKAREAIEKIKSSTKESGNTGELVFLKVDLANLTTIKSSVAEFQSKESQLDVLWNNAGVSWYPKALKTAQNWDLMLGTNCFGPHLFTQLLLPSLQAAAKKSRPGQVRIVWTSSMVVDGGAPKGGLIWSELTTPPNDQIRNYINSKTGNWFLASEYAKRVKSDGILSLTQNPGNLKTGLMRHVRLLEFFIQPLLYHAKFGAYTELYCGLSTDLTMEDGGAYIIPWGRRHPSPREDLLNALKSEEEGGTGLASKFYYFCEEKTTKYK